MDGLFVRLDDESRYSQQQSDALDKSFKKSVNEIRKRLTMEIG